MRKRKALPSFPRSSKHRASKLRAKRGSADAVLASVGAWHGPANELRRLTDEIEQLRWQDTTLDR